MPSGNGNQQQFSPAEEISLKTGIWRNFLSSGDLVFDVGANVGDKSLGPMLEINHAHFWKREFVWFVLNHSQPAWRN
jgi:hypothetical protein